MRDNFVNIEIILQVSHISWKCENSAGIENELLLNWKQIFPQSWLQCQRVNVLIDKNILSEKSVNSAMLQESNNISFFFYHRVKEGALLVLIRKKAGQNHWSCRVHNAQYII